MSSRTVLYVEDEDAEPVPSFTRLLQEAGFEVLRVRAADEARIVLANPSAADIDLVLLDRKIPATAGGLASESVGDDLFTFTNSGLPDVPIVVLSGYTDENHARWVLQRPGSMHFDEVEVRRFQHYRKGDSIEFQQAVHELGDLLSRIDGVELQGDEVHARHVRLLKKTVRLYGGATAHVRATQAGLSEAAVYLCDVKAPDGRRLTSVAVKVAPYGTGKPTGGFLSSIRANMRATPTEVIGGCCGGLVGIVSPLAGSDAIALDEILAGDEAKASEMAGLVLNELQALDRAQQQIPLSEFGSAYLAWNRVQALLSTNDIDVPNGVLQINETVVQVHGDLHLGNVLVMDGQPPCIIDFDSQFVGSAVFDPLMMSLGPFFHRAGSQRATEWQVADVLEAFKASEGVDAASRWAHLAVGYCVSSDLYRREFWAALLLYCAKQLKYPDVTDDPRMKELAIGLGRLAVDKLGAS